ncbi:MAG: hypothetical protein F6K11_20720, partial [Leptolyngbya sp. SIO3F4]|nr:hypothetical protein [Leptolyngbya sp. SIO3F4]
MTTPHYDYETQSEEALMMDTYTSEEQIANEDCYYSNRNRNIKLVKEVCDVELQKDKSTLKTHSAILPDYDYEFHVGGSIAVDDPCYVEREADEVLYRSVKAGKFAYVFNCRQMGKSSLRVRVENRLKQEGTHCAAIDLSALGTTQVSSAQWYRTLIGELNRCLNLLPSQEVDEWLEKQDEVTPVYRLQRFVEDVLLTRIQDKPIVIFIDEIDSVLSLSFPSSDFFAWIRACYNRQVDSAVYKRLTFVLLGVTTPSQLVRDTSRTPFNIGQAIELTPLSLEHASNLADGLAGWVENPQRVLIEVFSWTGGQPYLTQRLCALVQEMGAEKNNLPWINNGQEASVIADLVNYHLIQNWELKDEQAHFKTIRDRLLRQEHLASRLLSIYELILSQGSVPKQNRSTHVELRLSGLVINQNGHLQVFNPIYYQVFDQVWVQKKLDNLRPYAEKCNAWKDSGCADNLQLLRGQALKDALIWADGRSLNDLDHRFLAASQTQEIQDALEIKEKERQILSNANQKANKTLRRGLIGLLLSLSASVALISVAWKAWENTNSARKNIEIEQKGMNILQNFRCCRGGGVEKNLFLAMKEGQQLYSMVGDNKTLHEYSTTMPILTLQKVLDGMSSSSQTSSIHDLVFHPTQDIFVTARHDGKIEIWNHLEDQPLLEKKAHEGAIAKIVFSLDGRRLATIGSEDETAIIWEFSDSALTEIGSIKRISSRVRDLVFVGNQ